MLVAGDGLGLHHLIDLGFPCSGRSLLPGVPLVVVGRTYPHGHLRIWIQINVLEAQDAGFIVIALGHPLQQRVEIQRDDIDLDPDLFQVLLNHGSHAFPGAIAGIGHDREFNGITALIAQSVTLKLEALLLQAAESARGIVRMGLEAAVEPRRIAGRDEANGWNRVPAENDARQVRAIDRFRDGAAEIGGGKPGQLIGWNWRSRNLVEPELLCVSRGPGIAHRSAISREFLEDRRRDCVDQMDFTALIAHGFNLKVLLNIEPHRVKVRKLLPCRVFLPIIRIALEQQIGACFALRHIERSQNRHFFLR